MFDRRLITYFDWGLLALTVLLGGMGVAVLYSAVNAGGHVSQEGLLLKQLLWFAIGGGGMLLSFFVSYKKFDQWGLVIYAGCILLLVAVMVFGRYGGGARRWLVLGPVSVQPSELMKIAICIVLARYFARNFMGQGMGVKDLVQPFILVLIPFILIVQQPDLGTALLLFVIGGSLTLFVGVQKKTLLGFIAAGMAAVPVVWLFLKDYQKHRILTFLDPGRDPLGTGYHIIQSKIAIGSGQLFGKGFLGGTQNALDFLPEQHTDFILSVLAEEWGFVGCSLLLLVYLLFLAWSLNVAYRCRDPFGTFLAVGITIMNFWHIFINMGMVMGLLPVVGVPLPMVSYGGSSVVTTLLGVGILLNISMRRFLSD
ncbi:rod shape-determining protein RodA [Desulfobotulus sp. H1]|uniref:Peptidoglycan glycosyltransferase RodA n=1 Tax=Desulfobotulus pelophilus TaxID=2823377 RepID=A0ABT3NC91_9BACT|nr:rod shape-determining protein RodA [Desulfobotulus pelophilus]MCW7755093.1 rod shape-determining protein RodA [Desulfobotulus pelophilus]